MKNNSNEKTNGLIYVQNNEKKTNIIYSNKRQTTESQAHTDCGGVKLVFVEPATFVAESST